MHHQEPGNMSSAYMWKHSITSCLHALTKIQMHLESTISSNSSSFRSLQINLLFLVNILRILVTKLSDGPASSNHHEGTHVRKALRATLILFPLLGITNLLFFINPKNGTHDKIYVIFNATMQSSQVSFHVLN